MTPAERMSEQAKRLAAVLREHLPKDRYDDDGVPTGTFCTGCDWQGDYFADGEAGPFDDHLAAAILASDWLADYVAAERDRAVAEALREFGYWLEKNIASPAAHKQAYTLAGEAL